MEKSIYQLAVEQMQPEEICHHESDLYLKVTPISRKLVDDYPHRGNVTMFHSNGEMWFEVPFMYDPFWSRKI